MSEPEIARRCLSCGASVRQTASFCPQCGQVILRQQLDSQTESQRTPVRGPETQIIAPPSEGAETQTLAAPSEGAETQTLAAPSEGAETQTLAAPPEGAETQILAGSPEFPPLAPDAPETSAVTQAIIMPEDVRHSVPMVAETQPLITQTVRREPTVSETDVTFQPGGDTARPGTEHHLMDRVARIKEVSSVVIDQAAYDPSLRFLLVAAVLFILFVILMVLSKVIG